VGQKSKLSVLRSDFRLLLATIPADGESDLRTDEDATVRVEGFLHRAP
jgi:hypothetical protein